MKKCKYFGTDGIRGVVGQNFDADLVTRTANAVAVYISKRPAKVIIGIDTRASCDSIEHILAGTLAYYGIDVVSVGVIPTAALSYLAKELGADLGMMITASHSPTKYNGIKIVNSLGEKLPQDATIVLDALIAKHAKPLAVAEKVGRITKDLKAIKLWQNYLIKHFRKLVKPGTKIAIDCAFGSGTECAREVLHALGLHVTFYNDKPTGFNINDGCGATKPAYMNAAMKCHGDASVKGTYQNDTKCHLIRPLDTVFDIGFAFDGDADRCIIFDADGNHIHGDIVIYLLAKHLKDKGRLAKNKIAGTILFNLGIEKNLNREGIEMVRTDVGDAYVYNALKTQGLSMGGETSGHINIPEILCTGDGLIVALMVLEMLNSQNKSFDELSRDVSLYPQININTDATPDQKRQLFADKDFANFVKSKQIEHKDFRIIVRPSGTENIARVTVEGAETKACEQIANEIVQKIKEVL